MLSQVKSQKVAAILAFSGTVLPIAGLHKFYIGQPLWGLLYVLLSWTPIPRIASAIEGVWYLSQDSDQFNGNFNLNRDATSLPTPNSPLPSVNTIAEALRQLESLRQDGLVSEYEFEQKRRQLLDRIT